MARIASPSPIAASRPALVTEQDEAVADLGEDAANRCATCSECGWAAVCHALVDCLALNSDGA